jgi:hypothetical protein
MAPSEEEIDGVSIDLIPVWELALHRAVRDHVPLPAGCAPSALEEITRLRTRVADLEREREELEAEAAFAEDCERFDASFRDPL